jgi:rare lipoprotein A (peptidoglycan hydrolase)
MIGETITQYRVVYRRGKVISGSAGLRTVTRDDSSLRPCYQAPKGAAAGRRRSTRLLKGSSILLAALFAMAGAISELGRGESIPPRMPRQAPATSSSEVGVASWYGHPYHGRQAANGERYDMNRLTAAHRFLPFGTRVRVHNLRNARMVEVEITDRGPFVGGRLIDLSRAAARVLGFQRSGLARVRLEVLPETAAFSRME